MQYFLPHTGIFCPVCNKHLYSLDTAITTENMNANICFYCYSNIDVRNYLLQSMDTNNIFLFNNIFVGFGFSVVCFSEDVSNAEINLIDLKKYGIKETSKIIQIITTPTGSCFPAILSKNNWNLDFSQTTQLRIIGFSLQEKISQGVLHNLCQFYLVYYDEEDLNPFESQFMEALENFHKKQYKKMIIPAVCSIELRIKLFMQSAKIQRPPNIQDKQLLKFLMDDICTKTKTKKLDQYHINNLARIWGQRDSIAHSGKLIGNYEFNSAKKHIVSILFILNYIKYLEVCLKIKSKRRGEGRNIVFGPIPRE
ncbi:hypothetical protein ACI01nite_11940 [Acetobacter cibinongensis]|uniref:Apea-like HEPN domain-containing protein n=1 Tax=Acetobacter cibinongensis TaxID=146475 RepID=A0A0D6N5Z1_9PROT|nr:hypothetical protein [Acetobacter cibinongensis]GAN60911.1 hypothetical protein Abci_017_095 [Acetobacter cibinongensis]GBQ13280.1 hypothetical protein AA0482_0538 [Acetobacter cibinongensis NRIC 0482]GEL58592.1 hypothetical protein ACI01nite_11940 [Acetobacter cibinongensis]